MNLHPFLTGMRQSPDFLLHSFDFINRRSLAVRLNETAYRKASFLDDRVVGPDVQGAWFPTDDLLAVMKDFASLRPPHYLFHVSHCGSTLISRLLAELPGVHPVREPLTILSLAVNRRELERPTSILDEASWDRLLALSVELLARTYRETDRTLLKTTSACSNLAATLLARHEASRAVMLHVSLETILTMMVRAEKSRENGRFYSQVWLMDFHAITGRTDLRLAALADVERFAINWLTAMTFFLRAAERYPERVKLMDFDCFLSDPGARLAEVGGFLGLDTGDAPTLVEGPLMKSYAKRPNMPFDAAMRRRELEETRKRASVEIEAGLAFAEKLCRDVPELEPVTRYLRDPV